MSFLGNTFAAIGVATVTGIAVYMVAGDKIREAIDAVEQDDYDDDFEDYSDEDFDLSGDDDISSILNEDVRENGLAGSHGIHLDEKSIPLQRDWVLKKVIDMYADVGRMATLAQAELDKREFCRKEAAPKVKNASTEESKEPSHPVEAPVEPDVNKPLDTADKCAESEGGNVKI